MLMLSFRPLYLISKYFLAYIGIVNLFWKFILLFFFFCIGISDFYLIWSLHNLNENFQCLFQEVLYKSIEEMAVQKLKLPHHMNIHSGLWIRIRMLCWCLPIQNAERCVVFGKGSKLKFWSYVIEVIFACSGKWMISGQCCQEKLSFLQFLWDFFWWVFFLRYFCVVEADYTNRFQMGGGPCYTFGVREIGLVLTH